MSVSAHRIGAAAAAGRRRPGVASTRAYFAADTARTLQTVLGLLWLLDAGLQFQSFMYSDGFIHMLTGMARGQPAWLANSITWAARTARPHLDFYNTLFALTQVAIGLGLLYRRTVKPALILSIAWALFVWWFGEAFGMLLMTMASPLTGAPGAVILYALVALIAWPGERPGGLLGIRGARLAWAGLWVLMAWLWLETPSSSPNAITDAINAAPSGMSWLSTVQDWVANGAAGHGLPIALVLAAGSLAIGVGVGAGVGAGRSTRVGVGAGVGAGRSTRVLLALAVVLNLAYWVLGQGFGGIFQGGATDPNAAPLFVLLAYAVYRLPTAPRAGWGP